MALIFFFLVGREGIGWRISYEINPLKNYFTVCKLCPKNFYLSVCVCVCVCACACEIDYVNVATHLVSKLNKICYHLPTEVVLRLIVYTCSCT